MTIKVTYDPPPIPIRSHDWSAWVDGYEELGPFGRGSTISASVFHLYSQMPHYGVLTGLETGEPAAVSTV